MLLAVQSSVSPLQCDTPSEIYNRYALTAAITTNKPAFWQIHSDGGSPKQCHGLKIQ